MANEYINKDYYRQLAPQDRSFINLSANAVRQVIDRLNAEGIQFSATIGYKNTITVSTADRDRVRNIVAELNNSTKTQSRIIGNTPYGNIENKRYINTDPETANYVSSLLSGDSSIRYSGRISGDRATFTVGGDEDVRKIRRMIDNFRNLDFINELNENGYERIADSNGFVNIRNTANGETAGFESLEEAKNMFMDSANMFFHPIAPEDNIVYRIVYDEPNNDYYISEYDLETGEEVSVYLDEEGHCPKFGTVNDALDYAISNSIEYTNTNDQLDRWKFDDEERISEQQMYERNISIQSQFPQVQYEYPNDITYNADNHLFHLVYFNEDGDGGDGEFNDVTITEDDVLGAYNSDNFLQYVYANCKQNVIDTHSGYFEDYAKDYINKPANVSRFYDTGEFIRYMIDNTPEAAKQKNYEKEITADADELIIDGYEGTWYVVDTETIDGKELFLLESENYGDETFGIIIDKDRNVLVDEAWNGFQDYHEKYDNLTPVEKLAAKVEKEYTDFVTALKKESVDVIIESAAEVSAKDNIRTYIGEEELNLTEKQLDALLSSSNILSELYEEWNHNEYLNSYDDVATLLEDTANAILISQGRLQSELSNQQLEAVFAAVRKEMETDDNNGIAADDFDRFVNAYKEHFGSIALNGDYPVLADAVFGSDEQPWVHYENSVYHDRIVEDMNTLYDEKRSQYLESQKEAPLYLKSASYARDNGELDLYRASNKENHICSNVIDAYMSKHYRDNVIHTEDALADIREKYSLDRVALVVAINVNAHNYDGRISDVNKKWAANYLADIPEDIRQRTGEFHLSTHPGLLDLFANTVRDSIEKEREVVPEKNVNNLEIGDKFRYKGNEVEVVGLTGVLPFYTDDCAIRRESGGFAITENVSKADLIANGKYIYPEAVNNYLETAKKYIAEFHEKEYGDDYSTDFSDLSNIGLAYTTLGDKQEHEFQVTANLIDPSISYSIDGEVVRTDLYDSLADMIEKDLSFLDFDYFQTEGYKELEKKYPEKDDKIVWTPIMETADDNGNPTSYSTKYNDEFFWISENEFGNYDVEMQTADRIAPINSDYIGFLSRADAEEYFAENIDEYLAVRDEQILDSIVAETTAPAHELTEAERDEISHRNTVFNNYLNNNPKAVFREIAAVAGLNPTEDISVEETKAKFADVMSIDITLSNNNYPIQLTPTDDGLNVFHPASGRESTYVWGQVKELMYLIANENNLERDNIIRNEVMRGTGFEDGKFRVADFYKTNPTNKEFADFLKKEFGIGGHSGDGPIGFTNHDGKGIDIEVKPTNTKEHFTWPQVAKVVSDLIDKGEYITQNDISRRIRSAQWTINNANENTDFNRLIYAHKILQQYGLEKAPGSNEFKIYQLKAGEENREIRFETYARALRHGEPAKPENYDLVYTGNADDFTEENKLEAIYTKFNIDRPEDFKGHSLSVSDIIVVDGKANYVDDTGFTDVSDKFLGRAKEKINFNDYEDIRIVNRSTWKDDVTVDPRDFPPYEKTTVSFSYDEERDISRYAYNSTNSTSIKVWDEESYVTAEEMIAELNVQLEKMRTQGGSDCYIELVDKEGNTTQLTSHEFEFVVNDTPEMEIEEEVDEEYTDIPADKWADAVDAENARTDYGYTPKIGDVVEKDNEVFAIKDISDNMITLVETSDLFATEHNMTVSDFLNGGYSIIEEAKTEAKNTDVPVGHENPEIADISSGQEETKGENFVITDENLGVNTPKARFNANIMAIETLKKIESEGRTATPDEQTILSGYTGWGAIKDAFDPNKDNWSSEYSKLKELLTDEEYYDARKTVLNAHFTSPTVINAIYEGLANMGFESGRILEPSMGIGNFFGMLPENMRGSELHGVELDDITGRIAKQLYPNADIQIKGFEKTDFRNNSFDVAVGNVPFGEFKVNDKDYNKHKFLIHDYFMAKSLDKVRPGGVVALITSTGTMDKQKDDVRRYLAQRAELVCAIRLPGGKNGAFKENAGTEVSTDILFLQKRERPIEINPEEVSWINRGEIDGIPVNQYFIDHPEMVVGEFKVESGMFGNELNVVVDSPEDMKSMLSEAVKHIQGQYSAVERTEKKTELNENEVPAIPDTRTFAYYAVNNELYYRADGNTMEKVDNTARGAKQKIERALAMVDIRDTVRELLDLQLMNGKDDLTDEINEKRAELNTKYDNFVEKFGEISKKANRDAFAADNDYALLKSLEVENIETKQIEKADIFRHNTVTPEYVTHKVDNAVDALVMSVAEKAEVDFDFMTEVSGMSKEKLISELDGQIYRLPQREEKYVTADEYLTGNIRKKLRDLDNFAPEDMDVSKNREALEKAMPDKVEAKDISVKLGASWVKPEYIRRFLLDTLHPSWKHRNFEVKYDQYSGTWKIDDVKPGAKKEYSACETFGTRRKSAYEIVEAILNHGSLQVKDDKLDEYGQVIYDSKGNKVKVVNDEETKRVEQKAAQIRNAFADWVFNDPDRRNDLVDTYNDLFNSIRHREYDGSHLNFVGMNSDITLKEHQKNAIARGIYGGNTMLAHAVGAGKTFEIIAIAMEGKRLGQHNKSLIAVPNSLTEQFGNDFRKLYPNAKILVATKEDFEPKRRKTLLSKIATNDWDAVIVGHSQFDRIGLSLARQQEYLKQEIADARSVLEAAMASGEGKWSVSKIEKAIAALEAELSKVNDKLEKNRDDIIDFEALGVDKIFVDECHLYKNLATPTKMSNVSGLGSRGSDRAMGLYMKTKYLDELTGFKGVCLSSGTPISNSMCELYTMMRYLQKDVLADCGIHNFDQWAADFGEVTTSYELKPESDGKYQLKTRFAQFQNLPELMGMFKECADIRTADTLNLEKPVAHVHDIVAEPSRSQKKLIKGLSKRAEKIREGGIDPREDNMLLITNDGRKIGLDQRLVDPNLEDAPGSKVNMCIDKVFEIYNETADRNGTQVIFCDMSTPKQANREDRFEIYRDNSNDPEKPMSDIGFEMIRRKVGLGKPGTKKALDTFDNVKKYVDDKAGNDEDKLKNGDICVIRRPDENGENIVSVAAIYENGKFNETDSIGLLEKVGISPIEDMPPKTFNVYDDIKNKLVEKGVPANQIAFIHDYDTAEQKQKLFDQMNTGEMRVLLGSTQKCGAGANIQKKLCALHHLDCPLRPSDMEQRSGRIERQGNENKEVDIFRYVTNRSFDSYLYQILENKQKFISQIMTSKTPERTCNDVDEQALDYAEVKALCAGSPLIKEEMELQVKIKDLKLEKSAHNEHIYKLQDDIRRIPNDIKMNQMYAKHYRADIDTTNKAPQFTDADGKSVYPIILMGKEYTDRKAGGAKFKDIIKTAYAKLSSNGGEMTVGEYRGLKLSVFYDMMSHSMKAHLQGEKSHYCDLNPETDTGNLMRFDNCISNIQKIVDGLEEKVRTESENLEKMKVDVEKPFEKADELDNLIKRLEEVQYELAHTDLTDNTLQKDVFSRLMDMFPEVVSGEKDYMKLESEGFEPLHVGRCNDVFYICHTYEQNGDMMYDPRIELKIDLENQTALPVTYEQSDISKYERFTDPSADAEKINDILEFMDDTWLENIEKQGYLDAVEEKDIGVEEQFVEGNSVSL